MTVTKLFFIYNTTDRPYGGANSFNRALKNFLRSHQELGIVIVEDPKEADVFFLNAASRGPRPVRSFSLRKFKFIDTVRDEFVSPEELRRMRERGPVVHRLDGLTALYGRARGKEYDALQIELNRLSTHTVFQSAFCEKSFGPYLRPGVPRSVVFNGANGDVFSWSPRPKLEKVVNVLAAGWSKNPVKGHNDLLSLAEVPGVNLTYIGAWPKNIVSTKIQIQPPVTQTELAGKMKNFHFFCHLAANDPAPNVVMEALACGLPVLYRNSGGTPEMVEGDRYGEPLQTLALKEMTVALEKLKSRYSQLTGLIQADRKKFLIDTAARQYADIFKNMVLSAP